MDSVNTRLAEKLIALRGERSLNQIEKISGIPRSMLQRYEQGIRIPENKNLEVLARCYEVTFKELKMLYFEDLYPRNSLDRSILEEWILMNQEQMP